MSFTSSQFPIFLLVFYLVLLGTNARRSWIWLVVASCAFYMAFIPAYILILFFLIGIDFFAALWIERSRGSARKRWLVASIVANVAMLACFKYLNFLIENSNEVLSHVGLHPTGWRFPWALPIGLSFHTFQSMAYTIEVYLGRQKAERHLGIYALYVLYFPQMVAGPIERPQNLLERFHSPIRLEPDGFAAGARLVAWGFFKKLVVADHMSDYVTSAYAPGANPDGWTLLFAMYFFAFQIYCDFSGYTDIARGIAKTMGIDLMVNFDRPYVSQNPSEFWRRWHISLSSWFRDYVFIPLGGSRSSTIGVLSNFMIVFLLSGLWHGAAWTFVIWGACHGLAVAIHWLVFRKPKGAPPPGRIRKALNIAFTFNLVSLLWIFFRAQSASQAFHVVGSIFSPGPVSGLARVLGTFEVRFALGIIAVFEAVQWAVANPAVTGWFRRQGRPLRWTVWYLLVACILLLGRFGNEQFIYFQF